MPPEIPDFDLLWEGCYPSPTKGLPVGDRRGRVGGSRRIRLPPNEIIVSYSCSNCKRMLYLTLFSASCISRTCILCGICHLAKGKNLCYIIDTKRKTPNKRTWTIQKR